MNSVKKLFFVPVGLPGMGKSTLARHLKHAVEKNLTGKQGLPSVTFSKVSYDGILGENVTAYQNEHPETPFHEIIDIIRAKADSDYLDQIARFSVQ